MPNPDPLIEVVNIIANLIRSVHLKRVLSELDPDPHLNFWRVLHGNLLDTAVIEWCKLFGSDDEEHQKTHWKNVIADADKDAFREELYRTMGIDRAAYQAYWRDIKNYRDQHAAHRDFRKADVANYPKLDLALESCRVYYRHVIAKLREKGVDRYPDDLGQYGEAFAAQAKEIAQRALAATKDMKERVY